MIYSFKEKGNYEYYQFSPNSKNEKEMNLKELQPKQKSRAKPGEANITDILLDRVGNADTAKTIEAFYENQGNKHMNLTNQYNGIAEQSKIILKFNKKPPLFKNDFKASVKFIEIKKYFSFQLLRFYVL